MDTYNMNLLERRYGLDLNGDGFIGGEGYLSMLEKITRRDINGDGVLGRRPDIMPGMTNAHSYYPSVGYGMPQMHAHAMYPQHHHHHHHGHFMFPQFR